MSIQAKDYALSQETRSDLKRTLGRMMGFYGGVFGVEFPQSVQLELQILGKKDDYEAAASAINAPHWSAGFFTTRPNRGVLWGNSSVEAMMSVFLHESSHFLMSAGKMRPPKWANEGLAECFENARISGNSVYLDPIPQTVQWLRSEQRAGRWQSAAMVIRANPSWNNLGSKEAGARYAYGWALSHFLLSSIQGKALFKDILIRYQMGQGADSALKAIEAGYQGGVEKFDQDWLRWLEEGPKAIAVPLGQSGGEADGWMRCEDGRMVPKDSDVGCKTWKPGPGGKLILQ